MTPERLTEIKARAAAATPGPWERREFRHGSGTCYVLADIGGVDDYLIADCTAFENTEFIANARQDIPDLVAEVESLTEKGQGLCIQNGQLLIEIHDVKRERDGAMAEVERLREALREIADSTKWGEDTAIKREITRIQNAAAYALGR